MKFEPVENPSWKGYVEPMPIGKVVKEVIEDSASITNGELEILHEKLKTLTNLVASLLHYLPDEFKVEFAAELGYVPVE